LPSGNKSACTYGANLHRRRTPLLFPGARSVGDLRHGGPQSWRLGILIF